MRIDYTSSTVHGTMYSIPNITLAGRKAANKIFDLLEFFETTIQIHIPQKNSVS